MDYELLDSGDGKKLERFQDVLLIRPAATAIWPKTQPSLWKQHSAEFIRVGEKGEWKFRNHNLKEWWTQKHPFNLLIPRSSRSSPFPKSSAQLPEKKLHHRLLKQKL